MEEARLYCPDFRSIFDTKFTNPYWYGKIDSQLWPILQKEQIPKEIENLLSLTQDEHPRFYSRKITLDQLILELNSGDFQIGLVQALVINQPYGIPNDYVLNISKKSPFLAPILSYIPSKGSLDEIKQIYESSLKDKGIAAIVIYPAYQDFDLLNEKIMRDFCYGLQQIGLPLKIDVSDLHLPKMNYEAIGKEKIATFTSYLEEWAPKLNIIIAGANLSDLPYYIDTLKWNQHVYLELNHRILGGSSPTGFFMKVFTLPGFIQNWWSRILFGSGTPTLEPSQMTRGFIEVFNGNQFNFAQKCLMFSWGFRNGWRIYGLNNPNNKQIDNFLKTTKPKYELKNTEEYFSKNLRVSYDISLQSFSITQVISFQQVFEEIFNEIKAKYQDIKSGEIIIKSYHTTVSIFVNEHEYGNYLQLHYTLAEKCKEFPDNMLHTVAALEKRADFNFPDHLLSTSIGCRSITIPIRNGKITMGDREHLYAFIPFGPRLVKLSIDLNFKIGN